jgi:type III pantothenate kinase
MLLVLDIGNTNLTLGLVHGESIMASRRAATRRSGTADELELLIDGLLRLDGASLADVTGMALASVVPALTGVATSVAERRGVPLLIAGADNVPIAIRTERPAEVGADRLVNALAVARLYGTPAIVVDFGTATTFDCVAGDGAYVGGAITPGLELGVEALASRTARLPRIELREPDRAIGTDTISAMQSGVVLGYRALTLGLLERIRLELAEAEGIRELDIQVVLTGGLSAAPWARDLSGVDAIDPDLTLKGLAILWTLASGVADVTGLGASGWTGSAAASIHIVSDKPR